MVNSVLAWNDPTDIYILHSQGFTHIDIEENVFLNITTQHNELNQVVLADFEYADYEPFGVFFCDSIPIGWAFSQLVKDFRHLIQII